VPESPPVTAELATHPGLRRDILLALAVKAAMLAAIYLLLFSPGQRPRADAEATAAGVFESTPPRSGP
jgi:hypothetical protein